MRNETLSRMWRAKSPAERVEWLKRLLDTHLTLTCETLDVPVEELDAVALEAGLVTIYVTVVDMAGMRDYEDGVVGPKYASEYRKRKSRVQLPAAA